MWARLSLALATRDDEMSWRQPLLKAKTKAESDDMNFWLFSKDVLRPLLAQHKINFATQELELLMKSASSKPGHVSIRKFEQVSHERNFQQFFLFLNYSLDVFSVSIYSFFYFFVLFLPPYMYFMHYALFNFFQ